MELLLAVYAVVEGNVRMGQGKVLHKVRDVAGLGDGCLQELTPDGDIDEKVPYDDRGPGGGADLADGKLRIVGRLQCPGRRCGRWKGAVYGADIGLIGFRDTLKGLDVHFLGAASRNVCGLQVSGLANITAVESYGCTVAGLANVAKTAYGLQLAIVYNMTQELHGCQIAFVNFADYCPNGFQIGLVNIIMSNKVKVLPFVNGYF